MGEVGGVDGNGGQEVPLDGSLTSMGGNPTVGWVRRGLPRVGHANDSLVSSVIHHFETSQ